MFLIVAATLLSIVILFMLWIEVFTRRTGVKTLSFWTSCSIIADRVTGPLRLYNMNSGLKGFYCVWFGPKRQYFANDPEAVHWLISQKETSVQKRSSLGSATIHSLFSNSVVFVNGEDWRRQRKVYNPVFNSVAYRGYYDCFTEVIDKCVAKVEFDSTARKYSEDVDLVPLMSSFTLDLLGKSVFDYDFGKLDGKIDEYYDAYRFILHFTPMRLLYLIFPWLDKFPIPYTNKSKVVIQKMHQLFDQVVKNHQNSTKNDILSLMLESLKNDSTKTHLSREEFTSNLFILFVAGHETTAAALSWGLYEIARHPEIQAKMYQEIQSVVGDRIPTFEELDKLEYVDNFMAENLRLHPPVPVFATRVTLTDLHYGNQFIPKGSDIGFNVFNVHHNKDYWPDPFTFNPDRFSDENMKGRHKFCYLPFSLGSRMCLGNNFSLIEQRLFLARFLQKYEVLPPKSHEIAPGTYSSESIGGPPATWVSLKPRKTC